MTNRQRVPFGQGKRSLRRAAIIAGTEARFSPPVVEYFVLRCGRCGGKYQELMVTEHLMKCQPLGVKCGKCGQPDILPEKFLAHFKGCDGKKAAPVVNELNLGQVPVVDDTEMRRRENAAILAAMGQRPVKDG